MDEQQTKKAVREGYARIATKGSSSCCAPTTSCCGTASSCCGGNSATAVSKSIGYSEEDLKAVPEGANLGLGCGNPVALASLKEGETVLDLGSGGGFDCFLAAGRVGKKGKVIGVDMTPEMVQRATANARKGKYHNVEFRLGEIESLPVANSSVDVIISNCVINLSPDKSKVFGEAYRVLRPGGRLMVSDLVLLKPLPASIKQSIEAYIGCLAGAMLKQDYLDAIKAAGFQDARIDGESAFLTEQIAGDPTARALIDNLQISPETVSNLVASAVSVQVRGTKPK